jgi:hypothetical protein
MIDPNERLKRIFNSAQENLSIHSEKASESQELSDDEEWNASTKDLNRFNYFYHEGVADAYRHIKSLFRAWGGVEEEWFKLVKDEDM